MNEKGGLLTLLTIVVVIKQMLGGLMPARVSTREEFAPSLQPVIIHNTGDW